MGVWNVIQSLGEKVCEDELCEYLLYKHLQIFAPMRVREEGLPTIAILRGSMTETIANVCLNYVEKVVYLYTGDYKILCSLASEKQFVNASLTNNR